MPLEKPTADERGTLLRSGLAPLQSQDQAALFPVLDALFESVLTNDALLHEDVDNPVSHHTTVLGHILEIAVGEQFTSTDTWRAAAIAILHDMHPSPKITRERRDNARTPQEKAALELENLENRIVHMGLGCVKAKDKLRALAQTLGQSAYSTADIDAIGSVIAIHDIPSINLPIPADARLAAAFREADRLWMLSPPGILADLARKNKLAPSADDCLEQVRANLRSYQNERSLYPADENFRDRETFFRTSTGHAIGQRYLHYWFAVD